MLECGERLSVAATTGVAADQIGGSTIDHHCSLKRPAADGKNEAETEQDRGDPRTTLVNTLDRWTVCQFLILDEVQHCIL
jgi:hypothetical protein